MNDDTAEAIKNISNGKSLNVNLVNPPLEDPWRTLADYKEEQEEARERHAMLSEQHDIIVKQNRIITRSHRYTVLAALAALVAAISTAFLAYLSFLEYTEKQPPSIQSPQLHPPANEELHN